MRGFPLGITQRTLCLPGQGLSASLGESAECTGVDRVWFQQAKLSTNGSSDPHQINSCTPANRWDAGNHNWPSRHRDKTSASSLHLAPKILRSIECNVMANALKVLGSSQHRPNVSRVRHRANKNMAQWNLQIWNCKRALTLYTSKEEHQSAVLYSNSERSDR
jgi:hypothetical protein